MSIVEFLTARIAEDEAEAEYLLGREDNAANAYGERFLAECAAKRAIVTAYQEEDARSPVMRQDVDWREGALGALEAALAVLAAVYKDHSDYNPEWAA